MSTAKINDGGPAFPVNDMQRAHEIAAAATVGIENHEERERVYIVARGQAVQGMTLRDYFAGEALKTACAYATVDVENWAPSDFAEHAYSIADAMLKARAAS